MMVEELIVEHKSGDLRLHLVGKEVQVRDTLNGTLGLACFSSSAEAMRFVSEYIGNLDGPTEEFERLLPQFCF